MSEKCSTRYFLKRSHKEKRGQKIRKSSEDTELLVLDDASIP